MLTEQKPLERQLVMPLSSIEGRTLGESDARRTGSATSGL
jgi:hypothetical protein